MSQNILSEMQCRNYLVQKLHVEANEQLENPGVKLAEDELHIDYSFAKDAKSLSFMIELIIDINKSKVQFKKALYQIHIRLFSIFDFPEGTPLPNIKKVLEPNGLAMSYSIARGIVGDVTASALHGRYILPSVNFTKIIEQNRKEKSIHNHES